MKWKEEYDNKEIECVCDMGGFIVERGDSVVFAASDRKNRPYLCKGKVIGFTSSPSFTDVVIKTEHNRIVKKDEKQIISA